MSKDFPFTNYDFYAYLTSGLLLFFACDLIYNNAELFFRDDWSFIATAAVVAVAYALGQIMAIPSSLIIEHLVVGKVIAKPITVQLAESASWYQKVLGFSVGRYYQPFSKSMRELVMSKAKKKLNIPSEQNVKDTEDIFQVAYTIARKDEDVRTRLDDFRNQYGFARNLTFVTLLIILLMYAENVLTWDTFALFTVLAILFFLRFLKFLSAYHAEIVRTFAYSE